MKHISKKLFQFLVYKKILVKFDEVKLFVPSRYYAPEYGDHMINREDYSIYIGLKLDFEYYNFINMLQHYNKIIE